MMNLKWMQSSVHIRAYSVQVLACELVVRLTDAVRGDCLSPVTAYVLYSFLEGFN